MADTLRALVLGSGYAGKGHTQALRDSSVEVVGMMSRTEHVVRQVARDLKIPYASTDWQAALTKLQPDIVAVGTPGGAHFEPVMAALTAGAHIYCDKPLAATSQQARVMYEKAREMGVKTAYAASYRYEPHALLARELVQNGAIGAPQQVECISHYNLNPLIPFGWSHRLDAGGGRLNNNFTHKLSIVLHILDGYVEAVNGEIRNDMPQAPVVSGSHDFRERENFAPDADALNDLEWRDADAEWTYTVMARIKAGTGETVSTLFKHSGLQPRYHADYVAIYGSEAAIHIEQAYAQGPLYLRRRGGSSWEQIPVPKQLMESLPAIHDDDTQRNWTQLMREFVADIRGKSVPPYQTFRDGWIFQEIIEAVRKGQGWVEIEQDI